MQGFEFECTRLDYDTIEGKICNHYNLGYANSSSFMELSVDNGESITISAVKGTISCYVRVYQKKDSDTFIVTVSSVNIKRKS